jgi:hypothetical protein
LASNPALPVSFGGCRRSNGLHHPAYNFNDDAIIYGTLCWIKLVEMILAARCASADAARNGVCRRSGFGFNALS